MSAPVSGRGLAGRRRALRPLRGRYVPETLMEPLRELEAAYAEARRDPAFRAEFRPIAARLRGSAHAARPRGAALGAARLPGLPEARGPLPHRRPQDQQRPRARRCSSGAWASAAWSRRPVRASTGWRPPPSARCSVSSASSTWAPRTWRARLRTCERMRLLGRGGARGRLGQPHAQGRDQRGDARLGDERAHDPLPARLGAGGPPLPRDGARLPGRDRRGGPRPDPRRWRARCPTCSWPASAAARTRSGCSTPSSKTRSHGRRRGRGALAHARAITPRASSRRRARSGRRRGPPGHAHLPAAGRGRATCCPPTPSRRARLPGGGSRARAAARRGTGRATPRSTDDEALAAFHLLGETEGILPALESAHAVAWLVREAPSLGGRSS